MADGTATPAPPPAPGSTAEGGEVSAYFRTRLAPNPHRAAVWKHLCAYLQRWIPADADVLELGAGWCDFANTIARPAGGRDGPGHHRAARRRRPCAGRGG